MTHRETRLNPTVTVRDVADLAPSLDAHQAVVESIDRAAERDNALAAHVGWIIDPSFRDPNAWRNAEGVMSTDQKFFTNGTYSRLLTANGASTHNNCLVLTHDGTGNPTYIDIPAGTPLLCQVRVRKHASNVGGSSLVLRLRYVDDAGGRTTLAETVVNADDVSSSEWTIVTLAATTTTVADSYQLILGINSLVPAGDRFYVGAAVMDRLKFQSFTSTATAAGTTTLTIADTAIQRFTGSTTQTVVLPTTGVPKGAQYWILNGSTGAVTVQASDTSTVIVIAGGRSAILTARTDAPTTAGTDWSSTYNGVLVSSGKSLSVSNTLTLAGTDGTTMTFPAASDTVMTLDAEQTATQKTFTDAILNGTPSGSAMATAATASKLVLRDSSANTAANNVFQAFATTATAAGTTTLTVASAPIQVLTGSTTQTVRLPTTGVPQGAQYLIVNQSSGAVTVQSSGSNTIVVLAAGTAGIFAALTATPTSAGNWHGQYFGAAAASGKKLTVSNTLTFDGTDNTTFTFPSSSGTVAVASDLEALWGDPLDSGMTTIPRHCVGNTIAATTGTMRFTVHRARKSETINNLTMVTGNTAAGATPTLIRMGVFAYSAGTWTLVGSTVNDTSLFAGTTTSYTKAMSGSVNLVKDTIYAFAVLIVSGATMPNLSGNNFQATETGVGPRVSGALTGQTDLPSSFVDGDISNSSAIYYFRGS